MSEQTISFSSGANGEVTPHHQKREGTLPKNCERELVNRNICIYDGGDLKEHFNSYFKECRDEYNAKQKRKDRKVSDDYYSAVVNQTETYGKGDKAEKAVYHDIFQIGNRQSNGITDDSFDFEYYQSLKKQDVKQASDYCLAHLNDSDDFNHSIEILTNIGNRLCSDEFPNIVVHSCYIHLDEPNGTPHLDIIYSIVALDEKRGPSKRVSMNKGLSAMGFDYRPDCTQLEQFRIFMKQEAEKEMELHGMQRIDLNEGRKREQTHDFVARTAKESESHKKETETFLAELKHKKAHLTEKEIKLDEREEKLDEREENQEIRENEFLKSVKERENALDEREEEQEKKEIEFQGKEDRLEALQRSTEEKEQKLLADRKKLTENADKLREGYMAMKLDKKWYSETEKKHAEAIKERQANVDNLIRETGFDRQYNE